MYLLVMQNGGRIFFNVSLIFPELVEIIIQLELS